MLKRLAEGLPVVVFVTDLDGKQLALGYTNGTWFQVIGNHDQFWKGSDYETAKSLAAHVGTSVMDISAGSAGINGTGYYVGVVDGCSNSSPPRPSRWDRSR